MNTMRRQRGMTLVEVLAALAIASALLVGLSRMIGDSIDELKEQQAALQQAQVVTAAGKYIAANYGDLVAGTGGGAVTAVTVAQLKTAGFLSAGFAVTNPYQQSTCVLVRQPAAGKLDALVAGFGGTAIPDRAIASVAMMAGQGGGYVSAAQPGTARGASWELVTTAYQGVACAGTTVLDGTAAHDGGHLVSSLFYDGPGQLSTDFLYRDTVPGRPQLNQMNTPLGFAGAALVTPGTACGSAAAIGIDSASRTVVTCGTDGLWQAASTWKAPVTDFADLPATGNTVGDVRMVTALNRGFTYSGTAWVALAVDESGNLRVPATVYADTVDTATAIVTAGTITADKTISSTNGGIASNWVVGRNWLEGPTMYLNQATAPGTPCNIPNADGSVTYAIGSFKKDANGVLLACQPPDNVFKYLNGTLTP
ncbi:shufflon system plasmid conjugative transfer pilus tip adhesin PilV [Massilia luteola]|uniref:shufflon system plasmid conjugative transfer pilus tip adhesin PilV n=1 Tax=Massilia luteola TaxID=3081751 RepID=UPI002ACC1936|nr:shufflon system plasmid conjugative transfer pilus tip adhesin PilV [Massilia sp. Gc5]